MIINNEQSLKKTLAFVAKLGTVATFWAYSFFIYHIIQGQGWSWGSQIVDKKNSVFIF